MFPFDIHCEESAVEKKVAVSLVDTGSYRYSVTYMRTKISDFLILYYQNRKVLNSFFVNKKILERKFRRHFVANRNISEKIT